LRVGPIDAEQAGFQGFSRCRRPIAATFRIEQIREAAALQAGRHVHGKIVITL
jgi:hypothetical protein